MTMAELIVGKKTESLMERMGIQPHTGDVAPIGTECPECGQEYCDCCD
jgi:hypothetical protein